MIFERVGSVAAAVLAVTLARGAALFLAAFALTKLWRGLSAEGRHVVWLGVISSFLLIPLAWFAVPAVTVGVRILFFMPAARYQLAAVPLLSFTEYTSMMNEAANQAFQAGQALPGVPQQVLPSLSGLWVAGIAVLLVRLALGRRKVLRLAARAQRNPRITSLAVLLAGRWEIRRDVGVLLSLRCATPFTFGVRHPVILLPAAASRWPDSQLVSALGHELAHIRRRDVLTQSIAYAVCTLLWFAPPAWAAFACMLQESEACCDQQVIDQGTEASTYARHIVEMARSCRGNILVPGMPAAGGRKSMLKKRVRGILRMRRGLTPRGRGRILRAAAACIACAIPVLVLSAQARPLILHPTDPLFGTWVNPSFDASVVEVASRVVLSADGSQKDYRKVADAQPYLVGTNTLEAVWLDADGNRWYKVIWVGDYAPPRVSRPGFTARCLIRVNAAGDTLDITPGTNEVYPQDLDDSRRGFGAHKQYSRQ